MDLSCEDCSTNTGAMGEYYMLHKPLWLAHGAGRGFLCIGCFEARLGRELEADDFNDAPVNGLSRMRRSARLRDRLSRNANHDLHVRHWRFVRSIYASGAGNETYLMNVCVPMAWGIWEW